VNKTFIDQTQLLHTPETGITVHNKTKNSNNSQKNKATN